MILSSVEDLVSVQPDVEADGKHVHDHDKPKHDSRFKAGLVTRKSGPDQ